MKPTKTIPCLLGVSLLLGGCAQSSGGNAISWILGLAGIAILALALVQTWCYLQYLRKARRRRRKNTHGIEPITVILYVGAAVLLLVALLCGGNEASEEAPAGATTESTEQTSQTSQTIQTGWMTDGDAWYYLYEDGTYATGWVEMDGRMYYFRENGLTLSGWQEVEGITRYFREDGSMARGEEIIGGVTYFFTSTGAQVELVNPWNAVPEGYEVELRELSLHYAVDGIQVNALIYDALIEMMDACNAESPRCCVTSGYRDTEEQAAIYNNRYQSALGQGYSAEEAEAIAKSMASLPGYSEHQLGLAVDIVDTRSWSETLEDGEVYPVHQWLMEHSWEYGFILRYPEDKTDVTGIMYESWHYRYVGKELAAELHELGLTLEEYLDSLD